MTTLKNRTLGTVDNEPTSEPSKRFLLKIKDVQDCHLFSRVLHLFYLFKLLNL